jgi:hypothetical protein
VTRALKARFFRGHSDRATAGITFASSIVAATLSRRRSFHPSLRRTIMAYASDDDRPGFDTHEEKWFSEAPPARRPSQRPTQPAPAMPELRLDDSIAEGWFLDL